MATTSTTTDASGPIATSSSVPELWVYPQGGADVPPIAQTGNFGPVHLSDWVVLQWEPDTKPTINLACFAVSGAETTVNVASFAVSPLAIQLNSVMNQQSSSDSIYCHFYFTNSTHGNTVTFPFINQESDGGAVTYSAPAAIATPATSSIATFQSITTSSTSLTSSGSDTPTSASSATSVASNSASSSTASSSVIPTSSTNTNALSTGAKAGIGVGVALGVIVIAILVGIIFWQRRKNKRQRAWNEPHDPPHDPAPAYTDDGPPAGGASAKFGSPTLRGAAARPDSPPIMELPSSPIFVDPRREVPKELTGHEVASELPT